MNRKLNIILLMFFVLTMSCTKEPLSPSDNKPGTPVELRFAAFNTKATVGSEEAVIRVRIIIFGSESSSDKGRLLYNKLAYPNQDGLIAPVIITSGVRDIYLITNEPLGADKSTLDTYKNIATVADIEALELAYVGTTSTSPYRPSDIPMFVRHLNMNVYANNKNETNSEVERMMSKVTLNLNVKKDNFTPSNAYPIIETITIKNLPVRSYVVAKPYIGPLTTSEVQRAAAAATVAAGYDHSYTNTFYVPEYILSAIDNGAYLEIEGHVNGNFMNKIKWNVKVGDAMASNQQFSDRYDITRNRHYIFTGDIKSYGEHDVDIQVNVLPWNKLTSESEVGEYLETNSSVVNLKHTIANVSLKVFSNNLQTLKVNYESEKLSKPVIDLTSGVVTIKAIYNYKTVSLQDNWTTITIEQGRFKKTITVNYEPIVWAEGDIVLDDAGKFAIGWLGHERTLLFMSGSNIGLGFAQAPTNGLPWTTTSSYYTPNANAAATKNTNIRLTDIQNYTAAHPGDPCASVVSDVKWRIPIKEEFILLNDSLGGERVMVSGMPTYTFSAFKNTSGKNVVLFSHFLMKHDTGLAGLTGYYWSGTPSWLFIADEKAITRLHYLDRTFQLKVRCVRNFH